MADQPMPDVGQAPQQPDVMTMQAEQQQPQSEPVRASHGKVIVLAIVVLAIVVGAIVSLETHFMSASGSNAGSTGGTGGSQSSSQSVSHQLSPTQQLEAYGALSKQSHQYSITYQLSSPALALTGSSTISMEFMELNNMTSKLDMTLPASSYSSATAVSIYYINGTTIECTEISSQVSCSAPNTGSLIGSELGLFSFNTTIPAGISVSYSGTQTVAGRSCDAYLVTTSGSNIAELEKALVSSGSSESASLPESSALQNATFTISACIDKQFGIPLQLNESYTSYSSILDKNTTTQLASITATNFSTNVSEAEFVIPASAQATSESSGYVNISSGCIALSGFLCTNQTLNTSGDLSFTFGQNTGSTIYNVILSVSSYDSSTDSIGFPLTVASAQPISAMLPGSESTITLALPASVLPSKAIGSVFNGYIWLNYSMTPKNVSDIATKAASISVKIT